MGSRSKRSAALLLDFADLAGFAGLASLAGLVSLLGACGSSEASAGSTAKSAHEAGSADHDEVSSGDDAHDAPAEEEAPKAGQCDDGTCSPCGNGVCPTGWYCDESAAGGPACGWLPQCAQKNSCGCLSGKLGASCKCSEQTNGLHVTCK